MTKIEQKFQVAANSKIGDIFGKLNSVQKQTVSLFDTDRNGMLDAKEAKAFNSTIFAEKEDRIDCWLQLKSGKKTKTTVMKKDIDTTVLDLEKKDIGTKKIGNKKVHYVQDTLAPRNSESYNEIIKNKIAESYPDLKLVKTYKNGNQKYAREVYCKNSQNYNEMICENYVILNSFGDIVEQSEVTTYGESDYFGGRTLTKDGKTTEYYDEKNKKYGEIVKTGNKEQYKNENGKLLYSKVTEDEHNYVYYDANNEPMYKIQYLTSEPYAICTYLDKNGNPKKEVRAFVPAQACSFAEDMFKVPAKNPVQNGTLVL